ncbi:hypothetical protein [Calothrix sp. PCC 6303]|nr:hypothetical protein [Calothrix sp. PCC 6303]
MNVNYIVMDQKFAFVKTYYSYGKAKRLILGNFSCIWDSSSV